jgi:hypothetical protein
MIAIMFLYKTKVEILIAETTVICDFSEKYVITMQDKGRGFHWNNIQNSYSICGLLFTK